MASKRHIIVGGGTAGMNAITTIREIDHGASEVVLVSAERPYSRMVLPTIWRATSPKRTCLRPIPRAWRN